MTNFELEEKLAKLRKWNVQNLWWAKGNSHPLLGKHRSEETRKKLSLAMQKRKKEFGYFNSPKTRRKISEALKGRHLSEKTKRKMSGTRTGKKLSKAHRRSISRGHRGENSNLWKGGVTPENKRIRRNIESRLWREAIFVRDNWTCQKCLKTNGNGKTVYLHPHHIQNFAEYPEVRFVIDNGMTFCKECHLEFHEIYGKRNNNREQIEKFING